MITRIKIWFLSFYNAHLAESLYRTRSAENARRHAEIESLKTKQELRAAREDLKRRDSELQQKVKYYDNLLETAERVNGRYERMLEEEKEKIRVHETTIETLVAANNLHLRRYDAESAIEVRRKIAQLPRE